MTEKRLATYQGEVYPVDYIKPYQATELSLEGLERHKSDLLSPEFAAQLQGEFKHVSPGELHRLGLLIWGISLPSDFSHRSRQDGVVGGIDLFLSATLPKRDNLEDWDAGRLAVFSAPADTTPYAFDSTNNRIIFWGKDTNLFAMEYPSDSYKGPYYLRTDRQGKSSRLVVNPRPDCTNACQWCARAYPDRRSHGEQLIRTVLNPKVLLDIVESDENFIRESGGLLNLTELNIITGDMPSDLSLTATDYIVELVKEARARGFEGKWYYAGHQVETEADINRIGELGKGTYVYTVEHFERRREMMRVKGERSMEDIQAILNIACQLFGIDNTQYYYIVGLDNPEVTKTTIQSLATVAIPQAHVFTPYAPTHDELYYQRDRKQRLGDLLSLQEWILSFFGKPIPSGSNRSLFPLNGRFDSNGQSA